MKHRKWIALLLAICSLLGLIGCQEPEAAEPEISTIYDFEKALGPIGMHYGFGIVDLNKDAKYVSQGQKSLKITPLANRKDNLYMYLPFRSDTLGINYSNISQMSEIKVDIYSDYEITVSLGLYFSQLAELRAEPKPFKLKKGWNNLTVPIKHSLLSIQYSLEECTGLYVQFETEASEQQASIYLDNIRIRKSAEHIEIEQAVFLDEYDGYWEVADFEHAYQQLLATPYSAYNRALLADVRVVKAEDYGITAPSGERVLRIENYPDTTDDFPATRGWTQLFFADSWLDVLDTSRFTNLEDYVLKFDIYQEGDIPMLFEINFYDSKGTMDWAGITTQKGKWLEFSAPLTQFPNFFKNPGRFGFAWLDWDPSLGDSAVYYLDNMRIEKISE